MQSLSPALPYFPHPQVTTDLLYIIDYFAFSRILSFLPDLFFTHHNWYSILFIFTMVQYSIVAFPGGADGKESACRSGDQGSNSRSGRGNGYPLQYSYLENPMDRGALWATVHEAAKSQTQLGNQHFHFSLSLFHWMGIPQFCLSIYLLIYI